MRPAVPIVLSSLAIAASTTVANSIALLSAVPFLLVQHLFSAAAAHTDCVAILSAVLVPLECVVTSATTEPALLFVAVLPAVPSRAVLCIAAVTTLPSDVSTYAFAALVLARAVTDIADIAAIYSYSAALILARPAVGIARESRDVESPGVTTATMV